MTTQNEKVAQVLSAASRLMQTVADERDQALQRAKLAEDQVMAMSRRLEAEKVAYEMHQKGLNLDVEFPDLVEAVEKKAEAGELAVLQEAVKLAAHQVRIGSIRTDEALGGGTDFERFLVGEVG